MSQAAAYVSCLERHRASRGILAFTALPLLLARATVDRVERDGPGSKVTREEVGSIVAGLTQALDQGTVSSLFDRIRDDDRADRGIS
jgi:farnesyl-diphosphate farnesyltransferase